MTEDESSSGYLNLKPISGDRFEYYSRGVAHAGYVALVLAVVVNPDARLLTAGITTVGIVLFGLSKRARSRHAEDGR